MQVSQTLYALFSAVFLCAMLAASSPVLAQSSLKTTQNYISAGGLKNFEIGDNDNSIDEVIDSLVAKQGGSILSAITFHTEAQSFTGSLLQQNSKYLVIAELNQTSPQKVAVQKLHVINRSDVIGITAAFGTQR